MTIDTLPMTGEITSNHPSLVELARLAIRIRDAQISTRFGTGLGKEPSLIEVVGIMKDFDPDLVVRAGEITVKQCIETETRAKLAEKPILMRDDTIWQTA